MLFVKSFVFSPIQENTYILYNDAGDACIIDPGCYNSSEQQQLADFISSHQLKPVLLINTHCHLDHVFGLNWAAEKYQLVPNIHFSEKQMLQLAPMNGDMWGLPFKGYTGPLEWLQEGQKIAIGNETLTVLFTPGHSPGHVCFYSALAGSYQGKTLEGGFLIGGDVLFKQSVGRTDLPGGNHEVLIESILRKLFVLPDNTTVFSGHGDPTTIGNEKRYNPFLQVI